MSWRIVVISSRAKLDLQLGYLVVRGENIKKIHLGELSTLIIESTEVSLTAALLAELIKCKIKVIFCDEQRNPCSELIGYYGAHDTSSKLRMQLAWHEENKNNIWTEIVRAKIMRQKDVLEHLGKEEKKLLEVYLQQILPNDSSNREGHAAKVYFNALFGMEFTRATECSVNAALNYGYALILSACNREIVANGYITQLGLHHSNVFNMFNLGSDIMEPLRPFIDIVVFKLWRDEKLWEFAKDEKLAMIDSLNQTVLINSKKQVFNYAIKQYCKSIFDALNEEDISLIRFCRFLEV